MTYLTGHDHLKRKAVHEICQLTLFREATPQQKVQIIKPGESERMSGDFTPPSFNVSLMRDETTSSQWSDRVTKLLRSFCNIETFLDFLNAFGYRKIIYPC